MIGFLDQLAEYLATDPNNLGTARSPSGSPVTYIVGDYGQSQPSGVTWPLVYLTPGKDQVTAQSGGVGGVDMHLYTVPIWVIDDLNKYGAPTQTPASHHWEQPGYRNLGTVAEAIVAALRRSITLPGGPIARSDISQVQYGPLQLAGHELRAGRIVYVARQRVGR